MIDFAAIALQCGAESSVEVLQRIVSVESSFNPHAIGVVGGRLARQPVSKEEAIATARYLENEGWNFSLGLAQINRYNLPRYGLSYETVFEPCHNLRTAASIYNECFSRASKTSDFESARLKAFSCYYSGNFTRGFLADGSKNNSYVQRILNVSVKNDGSDYVDPIPVLPGGVKRKSDPPSDSRSPDHKLNKYQLTEKGIDQRRINKPRAGQEYGGVRQLRGE